MLKLDPLQIKRLRDELQRRGSVSQSPRPYDRGDGRTAAAWTRLRPLVEGMFLVMAADGEISNAERDVLRGAVRTLTGDQLGTAAADDMILECDALLHTYGRDARLDVIASELWSARHDQQLALSLVLAMARADDHIDPAERDAIVELAERLNVPEALETLDSI